MSADEKPLDDIDRTIILFVHRIRRSTDAGPTWAEVREAIGFERPNVSLGAFAVWWNDPANREAVEDNAQLERFLDRHPNMTNADGAWFHHCYGAWKGRRLDVDPLTLRLRRLKAAGYVAYNRSERSLDIGGRVRAELRRQAKARKSA